MAAAADIPALVQRLRSGRRTAQLQAARRIGELAYGGADADAGRRAIVAAGAVPALMAHMRSSSEALQGTAAAALAYTFAGQPEEVASFVEAGGVPLLLKCLTDSRDDRARQAAAILAGTVMHEHNSRRIDAGRALAAGGGLDALVRMLSGSPDLQRSACGP